MPGQGYSARHVLHRPRMDAIDLVNMKAEGVPVEIGIFKRRVDEPWKPLLPN